MKSRAVLFWLIAAGAWLFLVVAALDSAIGLVLSGTPGALLAVYVAASCGSEGA